MKQLFVLSAICAALFFFIARVTADEEAVQSPEYEAIFDGESLAGWTPKFVGHEVGVNFRDTFRVEDGLLTVSYENWDEFKGEFGHLFYETEYSHYRIRAEYRFVGEQVKGGPAWAMRNNGLMLHGQTPHEMELDQKFPDSLEIQLLGGLSNDGARPTANLCTPGTHVMLDGELHKDHCTQSASDTFDGDQWVTVEVELRGGEVIKHFVNGEQVMEYEKPQLNDGTIITGGTISLQAETAPTQFRSIEVMDLSGGAK